MDCHSTEPYSDQSMALLVQQNHVTAAQAPAADLMQSPLWEHLNLPVSVTAVTIPCHMQPLQLQRFVSPTPHQMWFWLYTGKNLQNADKFKYGQKNTEVTQVPLKLAASTV